jgi:hypothetical protein
MTSTIVEVTNTVLSGAQRKGHIKRVASIGAARRLIVDGVIDTVDLFLDRLRDRSLDDFGIGAGIIGGERDLRRYDLRKLRNRNGRDSDRARERNQYRDDDRESRPIDKNGGKHRCQFTAVTLVETTWPG